MILIKTLLALATLCLAAIVGLSALQEFQHPAEAWSYVVLAPKDDNLISELNKAGAAGWEVVSARRATSGESATYEMIMKRRGISKELMEFKAK